jgi:hypothetical protein
MKRAIIIMAKVPAAGEVKTRMQPFLTPTQSAELAFCLLQDTISKAESLKNQLIIAYSPMERRDFFNGFSQHNLTLVPQYGQDLGERMFHTFEFAFEQNLDSAVMIGTDSPTFPPELITQAFEHLENSADIVLAPTEDGGFYLIGLKTLKKEIFENVQWSSPETFSQTKENIARQNLSLREIQAWYDVDTIEDLRRLKQDEYLRQFAPKTHNWLKSKLI